MFTIEHATLIDFVIIVVWGATIIVSYLIFRRYIRVKALNRARFFIGYLLLTLFAILYFIGDHFITIDYYTNIMAEVIGIIITVFIIDRVNQYLTQKNERLYRDLALKHCKSSIFTYCFMWFSIYDLNNTNRQTRLQEHDDLEEFFLSDDFFNSVRRFNFANNISTNKTYAQYYAENLNKIEENFQNILVKYASKISIRDIQILEFFGGGSHIYKVFRVMDFLRTVQISSQDGNNPPTAQIGFPHINRFTSISRLNFQKHFRKLIEFINDYNSVVSENDRWTLLSLNTFTNLDGANADNYDW
jgi:hypothetical protein